MINQLTVHSLVNHPARKHFLDEAVACRKHRSFHKLHRLLCLFQVQLQHGQRYLHIWQSYVANKKFR